MVPRFNNMASVVVLYVRSQAATWAVGGDCCKTAEALTEASERDAVLTCSKLRVSVVSV